MQGCRYGKNVLKVTSDRVGKVALELVRVFSPVKAGGLFGGSGLSGNFALGEGWEFDLVFLRFLYFMVCREIP